MMSAQKRPRLMGPPRGVATGAERLACTNGYGLITYWRTLGWLNVSFHPPQSETYVSYKVRWAALDPSILRDACARGLQYPKWESVEQVAEEDPRAYHLLHYHYQNVEDGLKDLGLLGEDDTINYDFDYDTVLPLYSADLSQVDWGE